MTASIELVVDAGSHDVGFQISALVGLTPLLWNDVQFDHRNAAFNNSQLFGSRIRDIDNSSLNERTTVINSNCH